jgi:hypothetical protein
MPLIKYKHWRPTPDVMKTVQDALSILEDPEFSSLTLTLRQLYYQFIARGLLPENTEKQYKRLGRIVTDAREAGIIDWYAIEDRGRACYFNSYQNDPAKILENLDRMLGRDPWQDQDVYLEAWIEKQSLEPMLARPCRKRRAPYMACKGYLSASEAWRAGMRFEKAIAAGKRPVLIHLGDHDPSGMDMTRDNGDRLEFYSRQGVEVVRVALNMDQVEQYKPPELPSKTADSRERGYRATHGTTKSWELDALRPSVLDKLIGDAIDKFIDPVKWEEALVKEREMREESGLGLLSARWSEVHELVRSSEMPLERLKALDELIPQLIQDAENMVTHAPNMVARVSTAMRQAITARVNNTEPSPATERDKDGHWHDGYAIAIAHTKITAEETPDEGMVDHPDREVVASLSLSAEAVGEAMMPTPYVKPEDLVVTNDYDPKDPDEEEQDRFGDGDTGPVRGQ